MKVDNKLVGSTIKKIRIEMGLTVAEFGMLLDPPASDSLVSRWERGVNLPNKSRLKSIANIAGIPISELIYGSPVNYAKAILQDAGYEIDPNYLKSLDSLNKNGIENTILENKNYIISDYQDYLENRQTDSDSWYLGYHLYKAWLETNHSDIEKAIKYYDKIAGQTAKYAYDEETNSMNPLDELEKNRNTAEDDFKDIELGQN